VRPRSLVVVALASGAADLADDTLALVAGGVALGAPAAAPGLTASSPATRPRRAGRRAAPTARPRRLFVLLLPVPSHTHTHTARGETAGIDGESTSAVGVTGPRTEDG